MGVAMSRKVLIVAGAFIVLEVALGGLAWLDRYDIDDRDCPEAAKAKSNSKAKTI
jgi:hypothetical protein